MKKILTTLFLLVCCLGLSWADGPFRVARYDGFKVLSPKAGSIVMIGNSITDMHIWQEVFRDANGDYLPICGRGNSGSYSTEQSENIESYIANGPSKVFMMIGTNDIATSGGLNFTPEQVLSYVKSIVNRIHRRSPQTHIYLYPILNNNTHNRVQATWLHYNQILADYIAGSGDPLLTFVDIYDELIELAQGGAWSNDNLHPNAAAYKKWCHAILPYLGENVTSVYDNIDGDLTDVQRQDGLGSMTGGRATMFSVMPISNNDIMIFGDSEIKTAEWWELLGNANVKNRGTGWNNTGDIATTSKEVDATWAVTGADKSGCPKAIFVYTGTSDVTNDKIDMETVQSDYSALISKLKTKAPSAKIYVMAIHPRYNNESLNTGRITTFNHWLQNTLAAGDASVKFVDTYTPLLNGNNADGAYVNGNQYLLGKGSVLFANAMAAAYNADFDTDKMVPVTVEQGNTNYAMSTRRNNIGTAITEGRDIVAGTKVGDYTEAGVNAFHEAETAAYAVLAQETITDDEATSTVNALKAGLEVIAPTKENTTGKYFRIYTPNRGTRYLTGNGAGSTMSGLELGKYDNQVWQLEGRDDGTFDVRNVCDGSYMSMTSPISTSVAKPANGWTFGNSNTTGLFIITSGTNQLNQQNNTPYNILNWGGGSNTSDDGCKYKIVEVEESDFEHLSLQDGMYYTIAGYVARNGGTTNYVYFDGTTRSMSTAAPTDNKGVWKAVKVDGGWKFQSAKDKSKYLTYDGADGTGAVYTIEAGVATGCVSMRISGVWSASSETGEMGGAYKASGGTVQSDSYGWSTDWKITETEPMYVKDGQFYTIAGYVARNGGTTNYVYYDGTTRSMSTTAPSDNNGVWKAVKVDGGWKFQSAKDKSKYLTYDGADGTGAVYTIEEGVAVGCVSMRINGVWSASSETGEMGGAYKASGGTVQSDQHNWATDWKITETEPMYVKDGQFYTIAGYVIHGTKQTTNYVLYNGTTRSMSTTAPTNNDGVWKAVKVNNGWKFQSAKHKTKYLTYDGADGTGAVYTIEEGVAVGCVSMRINGVWSASSETGDMGGAYKSSYNPVQNSYSWSTDWKINEIENIAEKSDVSTETDIVITGIVSSATDVVTLLEEGNASVNLTDAIIDVTVDDDFVNAIGTKTANPNTIVYVSADATVASGTTNVVTSGVCEKLVLSDSNDKNVSIPDAFTATSAQYTRGGKVNPTMITKARYATIYMPYAFATEGLKVMKFKNYADGVLTFEEVENPEPNVPYLIRQADDSDEESVKIAATGTNTNVATTSTTAGTEAEFLGTYTPLTLYATADGYDYYGYSSINGDFRKVSTTGNPCYPFRAYFRMPHTDNARLNLSVVYGESGEVTRIDNIVETGANAQPIYNLNGTRVNKVEKGSIYIQGGRKIVTK